MKLAVVGANGRMGRAVVSLAVESGIEIVAAIGASDVGRDVGELAGLSRSGVLVESNLARIQKMRAECIIDFSTASLMPAITDVAVAANAALVSGTTGLGDAEMRALEKAQSRVPVLWEPNMSVGIFVLSALVAEAVKMLGAGFDLEIVEAHHKMKADAPSGTAMRLAEVAKRARGAGDLVFGRDGKKGARKTSEIGVLAVRGGDVIGDHTVHFLANGERLELTHRATSRELFAAGALRAASWIAGKTPGRYTLADVLAR